MIVDFSKFSSVGVGGKHEVAILDEGSVEHFDGVVIGGGYNILISPNPPKLGMLDKKFKFLSLKDDILTIGAATKSSFIYNFSKKNNISNFEFLRGIPGTLGGLLTMNAGLKGYEISNNLISVKTSKGGFKKEELVFSYRKSEIPGVILEAKFKVNLGFDISLSDQIFKQRSNQPKGASFGSCFTNPKGDYAARLIESVGLKGYKIGGCGFSQKHANFLINYGGATYDDVTKLIKLAQKRVFEEFGVRLKTEVVVL
ncbi:UDP-N-acetylenolpyruvoylglucosamine reductase [Campylobacter blaseri]|uniref:UDP-N-acetylenolpyruvoylglucosamine reductase n=1 Tax=Campylobacter blaseri TaxID=2042961 RepID=A0A2P8R3Z3_9BACT|nr:UDP-N-acetylmuramate dehydrogenase [Campylobacter blaseri]PSM53221.1 UDP-N-acetylenolpyruvoylglucosamine reductase [Campylobacter blaseri]PSM54687.1 UDP-N-acetylenolpyruvoylglucosamine reductase [Campylobacter blaseri]QKF86832.1 UDP-N-acetylenolpyruvoylglucosamine reductase [Campylobacter blaseri]